MSEAGEKVGAGDPPARGGLRAPVSSCCASGSGAGGGRPDERGDLQLRQGEIDAHYSEKARSGDLAQAAVSSRLRIR